MAKVRDALSQDARRCAEVHISSWRAGYDGLLPDDYLHRLTVEDRLPWWKEILAAPPEARELAIAVVEDETGEVCGFGSVWVDPNDARSAEVALGTSATPVPHAEGWTYSWQPRSSTTGVKSWTSGR